MEHSILNEPFTPPEPNVSLEILDTGLDACLAYPHFRSLGLLTEALRVMCCFSML